MRKNHFPLWVLGIFLFLTVLFNFRLIQEDILQYNPQKTAFDDGVINEFLTETIYQNLLKFKNPFTPTDKIFYPFVTDFSLNDTSAINVFFLFFLRPFFDIHRATLVIVLFNIFLANLLMFALLRKLRINVYAATIASFVFGFTPYLSSEILGHYTYTTFYFFPLLFLVSHEFIHSENTKRKILSSSLLGVFLGLSLYANVYYFLFILFGIFFYLLYFALYERKKLFSFILHHTQYFFLVFLAILLVLLPLAKQIQPVLKFAENPTKIHITSSVILSADLVNLITPSEYNPFYASLFRKLANLPSPFPKVSHFFFYSWNSFSYPGIILVGIYISLIFFWRRVNKILLKNIAPHFFVSMAFFLLMLGPFLKVFNRWFITLEEGIPIYILLPFLLLRFIPGLESFRAPARFIIPFAFTASVVLAFSLNYFFVRMRHRKHIFFALFCAIFFIDQMYSIRERIPHPVPLPIYRYINNDTKQVAILEIPFAVRDGLRYIGDVHAISPMKGTLTHNKPIIGGYLARVNPSTFSYYENLPFIGHTAQIIDKGNFHLYKEKPKVPSVSSYPGKNDQLLQEIDFLSLKYILLKMDEAYTNTIEQKLVLLGFAHILTDAPYHLYMRQPIEKSNDLIEFGEENDYLYTARGFSIRAQDFRWVEGNVAKVFLKTYNTEKDRLFIETESLQEPQVMTLYLNDVFIQSIPIKSRRNVYQVSIGKKLHSGINTVTLQFAHTWKPSNLYSENKDGRLLSAKLYSLHLQ